MNFHKSHLKPWGIGLVNKYPLVFLEADPYNVSWAKQAGVSEVDYVNLRYGFEHKEGWVKHVDSIAKKATEIVTYLRGTGLNDEDAYIHSCVVKEKFGGLRWQGMFKLTPLFEDLWVRYCEVEEQTSFITCEETGKYGILRETVNGGNRAWHRTLCKEEAIKRNYDIQDWER